MVDDDFVDPALHPGVFHSQLAGGRERLGASGIPFWPFQGAKELSGVA